MGNKRKGEKSVRQLRREKAEAGGGRVHYKQLKARLGADELFTPVDDELLALLERLHAEWGSWRSLGEAARVSQRWLRYVRQRKYKTLGYRVLDSMLQNLGAVGEVQKLEWYTIDQLVEKGVWEPQQAWGRGGRKAK